MTSIDCVAADWLDHLDRWGCAQPYSGARSARTDESGSQQILTKDPGHRSHQCPYPCCPWPPHRALRKDETRTTMRLCRARADATPFELPLVSHRSTVLEYHEHAFVLVLQYSSYCYGRAIPGILRDGAVPRCSRRRRTPVQCLEASAACQS